MSDKSPFVCEKHDIFEMVEKKRKVRRSEAVDKKTALQEIWQVKKAEKFCRGWYEVYCVQKTYAE